MKKFNKFIEISKALYRHDHPLRTFHTTFIIKNKKIVSIGTNNPKTHPRTLLYNYHEGQIGTHSELSAVVKLGYEDCSELTFVNVRLLKDLTVVNSKPCQGCLDMMTQLSYDKFYYTNNDGAFETL